MQMHNFITYDLGSAASQLSDGGIFRNSRLGTICNSNNFPSPSNVGQSAFPPIPCFLLGDDAFALDENLTKPYAHRTAINDEKVFNYRHSRARHMKMHLAYYVQDLGCY